MQSTRFHILLVEDHHDSAAALAKLLERRRHTVTAAGTCAAARYAFEQDPLIDLLVLDLGLPDGNGCDLLRQLLSIRRVPAIALTGATMASDLEQAEAAGFTAFIAKPVDFSELDAVLAGAGLTPAHP